MNFGRPSGPSNEARHAVEQKRDCWLKGRYLFLNAVEALFGRVKSRTRDTERRVGAPTEVAKRDVMVGILRGQHVLDVTIGLLALDERVANEHDTVTVVELKGRFELRRGRPSRACDDGHTKQNY